MSLSGLITRKGVVMPLTKPASQTRNPVTQTATTVAPVTQSIVAAILPATVTDDMKLEERTLVRTNQRVLYIRNLKSDGTALDFEPASQQTVVFEGATWTLGGVDRVAMNGGRSLVFAAEAKR